MPNVYKAVIVEDEAPARRLLHELLAEHHQLVHLSGEAYNGSDAIALINETRPDLIFLDIQLPDMLGLDVLKQLVYHPYVIFTTAYDEYALKAFDALSVDYLLKPLKEDRIVRALNKLQHFAGNGLPYSAWDNFESLFNGNTLTKEIKTLSVKKGAKFTLVQLSDIIYFEASDKYTYVHLANGQRLFCDHMLSVLEEKLSEDFVRVQKSYIVNRQKVVEIHKYSNNRYTLVLNNRDFIRIVTGPSYLQVIRRVFEV
ncbi:MAG: LytTR family DNA-binding domain-containing protein [Bacteroidota bacterium]|nr:LytTR family DNA-binding domain-containing protein [Bacteroidota bacterium]MDP4215382.1 LytTR family DNA-binding domain-containing protein [Bacteroidota bacterium]MDP4244526.1 LytTR family DNA-binding domain-containing protein [Bacteroidota bacterium]MDP4256266.1 LytTR family DNA-binding domain-containing protein [Bacteroidota bacterium]MDP4259942.1 LytTR family DNA-binding domain-containing protein [Bacteroidota bacterium]